MSYWRSVSPDVESAGINSAPAIGPQYVGAAFLVQTSMGSLEGYPSDDRLDYMAGIGDQYGSNVPVELLGNDMSAVGLQSVYGGTSVFTGIQYGDREDVWYDTLRPTAGFPLPAVSDITYANVTNDAIGASVNDETAQLISPLMYTVQEKSKDFPQRFSGHPAEIQMTRPWDIAMGSYPWTGEKVALQRPVATAPLTFDSPLLDAPPAPTGSRNADLTSAMNVEPYPITYRFTPIPWDTSDQGYYVDSGV